MANSLVFVFAAAGAVEAETPDRGGSAVAEPDEGQPLSADEFAFGQDGFIRPHWTV